MQLNMSLIINFFKRVFSGDNEKKPQEVTPAVVKRTLPSTPINPMADEVENSNTVTHDLIHEIEKNKHIQDEVADTQVEVEVAVEKKVEAEVKTKSEVKLALAPESTLESEPKPELETAEQVPATNKVEAKQAQSESKEPEKAEPEAKVAVKKEAIAKPAAKAKTESTAKPKTKPAVKAKTESTAKPKAKPAVKAKTESTAKPKAKPAVKAKTESTAKPKAKTVTNTIPKTIVLDEAESSLTTKSKRIIGHCKKKPDSFKVTHIVKPEQGKLRLNLTLVGWENTDGLSFVTYDIANDSIVFSKKCDDTSADQLNGVLLAWAREVHKSYY